MNSLNKFIETLSNDEQVKRFKQLEQIIFNDSDLLDKYKILSNKQKKMVNDREFGKRNYENSKKDYEEYLALMMSNIVVGEYLTLLNDINEDLNMIKDIITNEVNKELE